MKKLLIFLGLVFFLCGNWVFAQNNEAVQKVRKESKKLEKAVNENNELEQAASFMDLGKIYFEQKDYKKSESYFQLAKDLFEKNRQKEKSAESARLLAQTQENLNKIPQAATNYGYAAQNTVGATQTLNQNDQRRINTNQPDLKEKLILENISINSKDQNSAASVISLEQLAEVDIQQNNLPRAKENLEEAYEISKKVSAETAVSTSEKLADIHVKQNNIEAAVKVKKDLLEEDFVKNNPDIKTNQQQQIAELYLDQNNWQEAIKTLEETFDNAIYNNQLLAARNTLQKLDSLYQTQGLTQKSLELNQKFLSALPNMVNNDSNLLKDKVLEETDKVVSGLLKEKELNQKLIKQKNRIGFGLLGIILLLSILLTAIYLAQRKLKISNKKIQLQSLNREMNPHFIFNSLNSVGEYIANNDEMAANQYLTKFSKLMRGVMENSAEEFVTLNTELTLLENYLSLEKKRFHGQVDYEINVENTVDVYAIKIPSMLIQPFVENAIWHGIRYLDHQGKVWVKISGDSELLKINIKDNGIGIENSKKLKTHHQKQRNSRGIDNIKERINLLNDLYGNLIQYSVNDSNQGVTVSISIKQNQKV